MESILDSIKKLLGIRKEYTHFDEDIITHINTSLFLLTQLGVGPPSGYAISDYTSTWDDYIGDDVRLNSVKTYIFLNVKLLFDSTLTSGVITSINDTIKKLEWHITVLTDSKNKEGDNG